MSAPRTLIRRALLPMIIAATLTVAGCSDGNDPAASPSNSAGSSPHPSTTNSSQARHNSADVMFAQMMIPHHQQAVEMSDLLLAKDGVDPRVIKLARQIKAAQQPEIDTMTGWLRSWQVATAPPAGHDHGDMGMMDEAAMDQLRTAPAAQATTAYLSGMIKHHRGAITMAEDELDSGSYPAARTLARAIISSQQAEIDTMQKILDER